MGQGQMSLYMMHLLLVVNTCTKYEKHPSSGRKVMGWIPFSLQMEGRDNRADKVKPVVPSTSLAVGIMKEKLIAEILMTLFLNVQCYIHNKHAT